ncbi:MAG TPA: hypothetical protein VJ769_09820 [Actinomycetes bacterium]|nr:hypothetical protein [Actinomycetes bacterium]
MAAEQVRAGAVAGGELVRPGGRMLESAADPSSPLAVAATMAGVMVALTPLRWPVAGSTLPYRTLPPRRPMAALLSAGPLASWEGRDGFGGEGSTPRWTSS